MPAQRSQPEVSTWRPTAAGKAFTPTPDWRLSLVGAKYEGSIAGRPIGGSVLDIAETRVTPGAFWATVVIPVSAGTQARLTFAVTPLEIRPLHPIM